MKRFLHLLSILLVCFLYFFVGFAHAADPVILKNIGTGSDGSNPNELVVLNNIVYFSANSDSGTELWKSDGTEGGTEMIKDINTGSGSSYPGSFTEMNGTVYFTADNGSNGTELWKTDGTSGGTSLVKDIYSGANSSSPSEITVINDVMYFSAEGSVDNRELWKSDGTSNGTVIVKDISYSGGSSPANLTNMNGTLYFKAFYPTSNIELWKSDGTSLGTVLIKDIRSGGLASNPSSFKAVSNTLYFHADNGTHGSELWKSDGTTDGTEMVKDIYSGSSSSNPSISFGIELNSILYFGAEDGVSSNSFVMWKTDGTSDGTALVKNVYFSEPILVGSTIYFSGSDGIHGQELWKSDGTSNGTTLVKDIQNGSNGSSPTEFASKDSTLYFQAYTDDFGTELWKSDGTEASTALVKDIYTGSNDSYPENLAVLTNQLVFTAEDETYGQELWVIDLSDSEAPSLNVSDPATNPTSDATPTITGSVSDSISTISSVQYQVDVTSGTWLNCNADDSTFDEMNETFSCSVSTLTEAVHTIYVRASDSNGNTTSNSSISITIDVTSPSISLSSLSPDPTTDTSPSITGTSTDTSLISSIKYQVDSLSGNWSNCTARDGAFDEVSESFTCTPSALSDGDHIMYVRGTDVLGNSTSANYQSESFNIDTTPTYLSASSPEEGAHIRLQRPIFKFRVSTGSESQFSSYTISARHQDGTEFTISGIPVNAPSISNAKYLITNTGFNDGVEDNDFIYVTTRSSKEWESSSNDGLLKEGRNTWTVTAFESNGSSTSVGNSFIVDVTNPQIMNAYTSALAIIDGYLVSTQTKPKIQFTLSDNISPYSYTVEVYRQNFVLGLETSRTLVSTEMITPSLVDGELSLNVHYIARQNVEYGKYLFILTGHDKANNSSQLHSLAIQFLSPRKAEELLKSQITDSTALSIPELKINALLRRQRESKQLDILVKIVKKNATKIDMHVLNFASTLIHPLNTSAKRIQHTILSVVNSIDQNISLLAQLLNVPKATDYSGMTIEESSVQLRKIEQNQVKNSVQKLSLPHETVRHKFKKYHSSKNVQAQNIIDAGTTTIRGFKDPIESESGILSDFQRGAKTFYENVVNKEPTRISHVKIAKIGTNSVFISWETNQPAFGKVNFGPSLNFGNEISVSKGTKHTAKLTNLESGKRYYFEIVAQGKSYTYDSFYTFETFIQSSE